MVNTAIDTDVLIVGAGPVGLFLANECARRGVRARIIEARATQSQHSKALAIFPRTLEIFDMAGLIAPFLDSANRVTSVAVQSHGRTLARLRFAPAESPYPFVAMVPQDVTEALLVKQFAAGGGTVEYETTFSSAREQADHVEVALLRQGQPVTLRAAFVVGCDGAHSAVRHALDLPFAGKEYNASFLLADIEGNEALPANELQLCPNEAGPLAIFPISARRRRVVAIVSQAAAEAPSLELVRSLLAQRAPGALVADALIWSSYFRVHHRQVTRLRHGRIFIAGDAAHIHSPFGGQGMNTGLHDIWNLAWKLELAVRGRATEQLLDSYSDERVPAIREVIRTTHLLTRAMGTPSRLAQSLRDTLIPRVARLGAFQRAFVRRLSGLGLAYPHSPIIVGSGERLFDESLRYGRGIGGRFILLCASNTAAVTQAALRQFADSLPDIVELRVIAGGDITLVRPDGYVAYRARTRTPVTTALTAMRELLQRQVMPPASLGPAAQLSAAHATQPSPDHSKVARL